MSNNNNLTKIDILTKIEEKRQMLEHIIAKKNRDLKNEEVLEISRELDILITKYTQEIKGKQ